MSSHTSSHVPRHWSVVCTSSSKAVWCKDRSKPAAEGNWGTLVPRSQPEKHWAVELNLPEVQVFSRLVTTGDVYLCIACAGIESLPSPTKWEWPGQKWHQNTAGNKGWCDEIEAWAGLGIFVQATADSQYHLAEKINVGYKTCQSTRRSQNQSQMKVPYKCASRMTSLFQAVPSRFDVASSADGSTPPPVRRWAAPPRRWPRRWRSDKPSGAMIPSCFEDKGDGGH